MRFAKLFLIALVLLAAGPLRAQLKAVSEDHRQADRDAIRAHIDKIFQAYIHKEGAVIRATHSSEWLGFGESSRKTVHGIDQYMKGIEGYLKGSVRMTGYKMLEFDVLFYGDVALVPYIADVSYEFQGNATTEKLRVLDVYAKLAGEWNQVGSDTQLHPDTLEAEQAQLSPLRPDLKKGLLDAREAVWRAYFANDQARLGEMIPPEMIAINNGEEKWASRDDILAGAKSFADGGGKLVRLEFPETQMQVYGSTAILYSKYLCEMEMNGKQDAQSGRATEIFVYRDGKWVNTGWHLDSGK